MSTAISPDLDRAAWLDWRKGGIGSSDMPAILGVSPFKTALDVYLDKIGESTPELESEVQAIGLALESGIASLYTRATGRTIERQQVRYTSPALSYFRATVDGETDDGRIVEFKTGGLARAAEIGEEGTDQLPNHWIIQAAHQMLVSGAEVVDFAVLTGGHALQFRTFTVERDEGLISLLNQAGREFWARVQERRPPEPTLPADSGHLPALLGPGAGEIDLDDQAANLVGEYEAIGLELAEMRAIEQRRREIRDRLLLALGDHASGRLADGRIVSRKLVTVAEQVVTRKGYEYFNLSIKAPKGGR